MLSRVITFGCNDDGQLGRGDHVHKNTGEDDSIQECNLPKAISFLDTCFIISVSCGSRHTLALSSKGDLYSWGWGKMGQLGHGNDTTLSNPTQIKALTDIAFISSGGCHSAAISTTGRLVRHDILFYFEFIVIDIVYVGRIHLGAVGCTCRHYL